MTDHFVYPFPLLPETHEEKLARSFARRVQKNFEAIKLKGLGGFGSPFVTIAASNTPAKQAKFATYKCTGTDDQTTFAQALSDGHTSLWALWGDFMFTGAPYSSLSDVGLDATTWVGIRGLGRASVIHIEGADAVAFHPGLNDDVGAEISHLAFENKSDGADSVIEAGTSTSPDRVFLHDLYFETPDDSNAYATAIYSGGNVTMENIRFGFFNCEFEGIISANHDVIRGLYCSGYHGSNVIDATGEATTQILNCVLADNECSGAAVDLSSSTDCLLQGCTVTGTTGGGPDVKTTSATRLRESTNLIGTRA